MAGPSFQHINGIIGMWGNDVQVLVNCLGKVRNPVWYRPVLKHNCYLFCLWTTSWPHNKTDRSSSRFLHINQLVLFKHYIVPVICIEGKLLSENAVQPMVWKGHECVDLWNAEYVTTPNIVGIQTSKKLIKSD